MITYRTWNSEQQQSQDSSLHVSSSISWAHSHSGILLPNCYPLLSGKRKRKFILTVLFKQQLLILPASYITRIFLKNGSAEFAVYINWIRISVDGTQASVLLKTTDLQNKFWTPKPFSILIPPAFPLTLPPPPPTKHTHTHPPFPNKDTIAHLNPQKIAHSVPFAWSVLFAFIWLSCSFSNVFLTVTSLAFGNFLSISCWITHFLPISCLLTVTDTYSSTFPISTILSPLPDYVFLEVTDWVIFILQVIYTASNIASLQFSPHF